MKRLIWTLVVVGCAAGQQPVPAPDVRPEVEEAVREVASELASVQAKLAADVALQVGAAVSVEAAEKARAAAQARLARMDFKLHGRPDRIYRQGMELLDRRQWDKAVEAFEAVAAAKAERADGALYWKAYSQHKLGRREDALASLARLRSEYGSSAWLNDARQLEQEVRKATGQRVSPEQEADEDLKLLAINSLIHSEPERAVPLLEKILTGSGQPRLRERALFVLAQTNWPKGVEVLSKAARGGLNPDLQMKALEYLGARSKENAPLLAEVYASSTDRNVKRAALDGLGNAKAEPELWKIYQSESAPELKKQIVESLARARAYDRLFELAKTERDPVVLREVIESLGRVKDERTTEALRAAYANHTDIEVRKEVIDSLFRQGNAPVLIEIARKESEPKLKREVVEALSRMRSKEANDFLVELLSR